MILHLMKKDVREHARSWLILLLLQSVLLGAHSYQATRFADDHSRLLILPKVEFFFLPILSHLLGHQLFTIELRSRTILFLEGLPVSRAQAYAGKLLLGLLVGVGFMATAYGWLIYFTHLVQPVDLRLALDVAARAGAVALLILSVGLLAAVLGKFRIPLYLALLFAAGLYIDGGGDPSEAGPFALLTRGFGTTTDRLPMASLFGTLAAAFLATVVSGVILTMREGSVAILLGERMRHSEKVGVAAVLMSIAGTASLLAEHRPKEPFRFKEDGVVSRRGLHSSVSIQSTTLSSTTSRQLLERSTALLELLAERLDIDQLPPLFLAGDPGRDPGTFERATLNKKDGVLIRAALHAEHRAPADLLVFAATELLDRHTRGRSRLEAFGWLREAYPLWLAEPEAALAWRRAIYAADRGFGPKDLDRWHQVEESLGRPIARGLAWSFLQTIAERSGPAAVDRLAKVTLGAPVSPWLWRSLAMTRGGNDGLLEREVHLSLAQLERAWQEAIQRERLAQQAILATIPKLDGEVRVEAPTSLSRRIRYQLSVEPAPPEARFFLLWSPHYVLNDPLDEASLERSSFEVASKNGALSRSFSAGSNLFVAFAMVIPALGCEVRFGAQRWVLP